MQSVAGPCTAAEIDGFFCIPNRHGRIARFREGLTGGDPIRILPVSGYDIDNGNAFSTDNRKELRPPSRSPTPRRSAQLCGR